MREQILAEDFLTDKNREEQKGFLLKAEKELEGYEESLAKLKDLYVDKDFTKEQYTERKEEYLKLIEQRQDEIGKLREVIQRPAEVAKSVKRATGSLATEVLVVTVISKWAKDFEQGGKLEILTPKTQDMLMDYWIKGLVDLGVFVPGEMSNEDLIKLIFQQKRLILQKYIGDKGVEVFRNTKGTPSYKFHFSIESST
jgi:hypothetical protein